MTLNPGDWQLDVLAARLDVPLSLLHKTLRGAGQSYTRGWVKLGKKRRYLHKPRGILRTIQINLASGPLLELSVSTAATDVQGIGVIRNAERHIGHEYVSLRDIHNCYHSIRPELVTIALERAGVESETARVVTRLVTVDGLLPQGAPTSPRILDLVLNSLDMTIATVAAEQGTTYSRYADDLCFSGDTEVGRAVAQAEEELYDLSLRLNPEKSRDWGPGEVKTVTGIVVGATLSADENYVRDLERLISDAPSEEIWAEMDMLRGRISWIRQIGDTRADQLERSLSLRLNERNRPGRKG